MQHTALMVTVLVLVVAQSDAVWAEAASVSLVVEARGWRNAGYDMLIPDRGDGGQAGIPSSTCCSCQRHEVSLYA